LTFLIESRFSGLLHLTCYGKLCRNTTVWNRLPAHRSRLVQDYLASLQGCVATAFLPPYLPELKPVEFILGLLEAARVAERLSSGLLPIDRNRTPDATSHAPPSAPDHCLLAPSFFVVTLY
jgi:transposase